MTPDEADRLAHHINLERPEWPVASLRTLIVKKLASKPYRDALHAFIDCAADPDTNTPARVLEAGPWWTPRPGQEKPRPVTSGPEAMFCRYEMVHEDGRPRVCGRVRPVDDDGRPTDCDHGLRAKSTDRQATINQARRQLADAQGAVERAEGEAEMRREAARGVG